MSVHVAILHPDPGPDAGRLTAILSDARARLAERHRQGFFAAGATSAIVIAGPADGRSFGARLRELAREAGRGGLVVLGSGAVPLATVADRRRFVAVAASTDRVALANNRYSADIVAIARSGSIAASIPDLPTDNALPRWLAESAGYEVDDLAGRWRLGVDLDSPLDLVLLGGRWAAGVSAEDRGRVTDRIRAVRVVAADPRAELVVTGRTSPATLAWVGRTATARVRALIEERGLRTSTPDQRPPASVLGALLDRDGAASLGDHLARLGEAAIVDTRVLLAHRLGADEARWPSPDDRFASDLLLPEAIADPWLRDLTRAAVEAPIPILLGAHTLVGPGLRLVFDSRRARTWT